MQIVQWIITVGVFLISIISIIVKVAQMQTSQNELIRANTKAIALLESRVHIVENVVKPSSVCTMHFSRVEDDMAEQKKKLSEQISRNIETERKFAVVEDKVSYMTRLLEKIDERLERREGA